MHTAAFRHAGIHATYDAVRVTPDDLSRWLEREAGAYRGFNVTIPHKEAVAERVDAEAHAARLRAVNTVVCNAGRLHGYNTDYAGFERCVQALGVNVRGQSVVLFGAGGSARAVVRSLLDLGAYVTVVNRTRERADDLLASMDTLTVVQAGGRSGRRHPPVSAGEGRAMTSGDPAVHESIAAAVLLVNTTSLGMSHLADLSPLPDGASLLHRPAVVDLVYGRETPLVRVAREAGCAVFDGIEMLVQQGALSFGFWTGIEPDLDVMRQACRAELERR
jgi:shikimate dehydrogenase